MHRVAVVGGGPAGLMVAEVLASSDAGVAVTVLDRMPSVGRKLQLAGRGGLNLTHSEPLDRLLSRYGPEARAVLEPAIRAFDPDALRAWSGGLGQRAVIGTSGRSATTPSTASGWATAASTSPSPRARAPA